MVRRLFVGNLSYDVSASALRSLLDSCGEVAEVEIATDRKTERPLGYALVTMATNAGARAAIERLTGVSFEGRPLHVVADEEGASRAHASDWPTVAAALAKREVRVITAEEAFGAEQGWFELRGIRGSVCVPLCDDERRIGVLFFDFDASTRPVDRADLAFLTDVGERCARALGRSGERERS